MSNAWLEDRAWWAKHTGGVKQHSPRDTSALGIGPQPKQPEALSVPAHLYDDADTPVDASLLTRGRSYAQLEASVELLRSELDGCRSELLARVETASAFAAERSAWEAERLALKNEVSASAAAAEAAHSEVVVLRTVVQRLERRLSRQHGALSNGD